VTTLRVEQNGRVRRLTLARPEKRNVLDRELADSLLSELAEAEADPGTGAILLDADGEVFCGGLDTTSDIPGEIFRFGLRVRKPVIAAVKGVAISAGVALVANAQVAVACQGSTFGLTDIRDGCVHSGLLEAAAVAMGLRRTMELALTGRIFSTQEALSWGLIHAVAPAIEFEDRAYGVAAIIADADPESVRSVLDATGFIRRAHGD
jgi:enoyl-CoA hydratase/carnithine racemase